MDSAFDGTEAVAKMESSKGKEYDLILMDIQIPGMNGHIAKPIDMGRIKAALAAVWEHR